MNRPKILHVGGVLYWTIRTRNPDTQVLKDADSTPTVTVRKNGASTGDSVTVTKRSATTGIYDCSFNPAGEVEGDEFTIEETVTVTGTTTAQASYSVSWEFTVIALERGTDGANTVAPANSTIANIYSVVQLIDADVSTMPADVWAVGTRTITGGTITNVSDKTGYSLATAPPTAAAIADAVWDEARTGHTATGTFGFFLDAQVSQIAGGGGTIIIDTNGVNAIVNALLAQGPTLYTALTTEENTLRVADEYVQQFRGLGDISGRSNIAFALKTRKTDADTAALIYLTETGGLTRVNGAAYATTANGSITIDDATAGNITVRLSSAVTASLTVGKRQDCVKILMTGGNDITKRQGITNVIDATVDALAT